MQFSALQVLLGVLLLICLGSFAWAMRYFFTRPAGTTPGMRVVAVSGQVCAAMHFAAILFTNAIPGDRAAIAALMYLFALALFWWALRTSQRAPLSAIFSPDSPAHLVESGPYRFVRHPFYCSYLTVWTAGLVATARLWLIPTVVLMLAVYGVAAATEERKFARSLLAPAYDRYRSRTGLLLPNVLKILRLKL